MSSPPDGRGRGAGEEYQEMKAEMHMDKEQQNVLEVRTNCQNVTSLTRVQRDIIFHSEEMTLALLLSQD